ncbi:hypothetical protein D3C77_621980 [compost metagenome]
MSGLRLPKTSLSGPAINCPSASPSRHAVRVNCAIDAVVFKSSASLGNAGRYISSERGPNADNEPKIIAFLVRLDEFPIMIATLFSQIFTFYHYTIVPV